MYSIISKTYNNSNWPYLSISDDAINKRYEWVRISIPFSDKSFSWAHERDIVRLFMFCRTYSSNIEAKRSLREYSNNNLNTIHLYLLESFCYPDVLISETLDELIDRAETKQLLDFIWVVLDRSLLWYNDEPCWPSDFINILYNVSGIIERYENKELEHVETPEIAGVDFVSFEDYTHVFYKFQNLINGISKEVLYYSVPDLSRQAYHALLKAMTLFFESQITHLDNWQLERNLNEIAEKETNWCKAHLKRLITAKSELSR